MPAIKYLKKKKINVIGPVSPDTSFMIYKKYKLDPKKYIKNVNDRPGKDKDYKINDRETRKKLKWNNNYNLQMGVNETIEWYKSYENQFDVKDEKFIIKK